MKVQSKTTEAERLTNWASEPKWKDLHGDLDMAESAHNMFLSDLEDYRETVAGGPVINVRKGKSSARPLLVRKNNEWKYSQLEEPYLSTPNMVKLKPKGPDDAKTYKQTQQLINHYWEVDIDRIKLFGDLARCVTDDGTVIIKNGWYSEKEDYTVTEMKPVYATAEESMMLMSNMVQTGQMTPEQMQARMDSGMPMQIGDEPVQVTKQRLKKNHPTHHVCELEHVIVDPTAKGVLQDAQFIIHEYDIDYSTLIKDKWDPASGSGYYKNLDSIDFKKDLEEGSEHDSAKRQTFVFSDKARKKVRIREYWGKWDIEGKGRTEMIVASWIGETMVRMEKNPFPHKQLPFSYTTYMPVRGQFHGEPDAPLLKENQEAIGKLTRAFHDITKTNAIGQKLVMEDTFSSQAEWNAFERGNNARFRAGVNIDHAIKFSGVQPVDKSVFQGIEMQQKEAESLTGNATYNQGLAGASSNGSVGGLKAAATSSQRRELSLLRRISSLVKDMVKQDIANMQAFASPEEIVRITNEEYVTIKLSDIQGNYDINIAVSTPSKDNETAETLAFVLQTAGEVTDPKIRNIVLADILDLKGRPDLARTIREFEPQPSEAQTKMEEMQMQNAMLENQLLQAKINDLGKKVEDVDSKIDHRKWEALENEADVVLKYAKASEHESRKSYYDGQTDLADQRYIKEQDGTTRRESVEDQVYREEVKQKIADDKNRTALENKVQGEDKTKTGEQ